MEQSTWNVSVMLGSERHDVTCAEATRYERIDRAEILVG
jgi:hypothetical protein